jgi:BirA family transcriptional regulator, biotin operon repressor / biotin---[acetyl-CoA-carboxylase] ligase
MSVRQSPNTVFIGKHRLSVLQTDSTNTLAKTLIEANLVFDGSVVVTANQLAGRGQRENNWISEPDKNLTLSIVLRPTFLTGSNAYWLYLTAALAVYKTLEAYCSGIKIKWPNDIYCEHKKIAGILTENSLKGELINWSVLGIGINVNQVNFNDAVNATSLTIRTQKEYDLSLIENELCLQLEKKYLMLKAGNYEQLKKMYFEHLLGYNEWLIYKSAEIIFKGKIIDIDNEGRLMLEDEKGNKTAFGFKEIEFLG